MNVHLSSDEIALLVVLIAKLDTDRQSDSVKALIYKSRHIVANADRIKKLIFDR